MGKHYGNLKTNFKPSCIGVKNMIGFNKSKIIHKQQNVIHLDFPKKSTS